MNGRLIVGALVIPAMVLFAACRDRQQEAAASEVAKLDVKAEVSKPQTTTVVAPYDGRVDAVRVAEGAAVNAGDVLLTIQNPTVERDLAYARAQVALAEYRLRHAGEAPRPRKPASVPNDDRVRAAQQIADSRKSRLDRYESLYKTHDITADDLENARMEYANAMRELAAARETREGVPAADTPAGDAGLLRLDLDKARAELGVIEDRQRQLTVAAPVRGTVTRLLASQGQSIFPRDPLFEITDLSTLEVRGLVAPELLRHVRAGMPVEVKVFSVPPRRFTANIRAVIPPVDASGATIVVPVANPEGALQAGTPATITVR